VVALVVPPGRLHVVAQVVEPELAVGPVSDVALVGLAAVGRLHVRLDVPGGHADRPVDGEHPLAVAAGQVIVDGDNVDAIAGERVEDGGEGGDQGLALTGNHLGDVVAVQGDPADDLDIVVPHVLGALGGFAAGGERLRQQVVQGRSGR
jgi:hypothetical protein